MKKFLIMLFTMMMPIFAMADPIADIIKADKEKELVIGWVIQNKQRGKVMTYTKARSYVNAAYEAGELYDIDPKLILGMMAQESRFNENARSSYGAIGLMQVVPKWHKKRFKGKSYTNPRANVMAGTEYLRELIDKTGSVRRAVHLYSGGARDYHRKIHAFKNSLVAHTKTDNNFQLYSFNQIRYN